MHGWGMAKLPVIVLPSGRPLTFFWGVKEGREERSGKDNYLPFKVCYDDAEPYVLYGRSVAEIKIQLRKIYRPEVHKKIYVKRLYPNEVIKMYYDLRQRALTNQ